MHVGIEDCFAWQGLNNIGQTVSLYVVDGVSLYQHRRIAMSWCACGVHLHVFQVKVVVV